MGPYMHDGSIGSLEEVVKLYATLGAERDPAIGALVLSTQDMRDLTAFLRALSGEGWRGEGVPREFPR